MASAGKWVFLPAVLMIYAAIVPPEVRITVAEQTFYTPRLVQFALLPWLLLQTFRNPIRFVIWDAMIAIASFWMVLSFMMIYGPADGFAKGVALALDLILPYLIGRYSIRSATDFRRTLVFASAILPIVGLSMAAEAFSGQLLVRPFFAEIFGRLPRYEGGIAVGAGSYFVDYRLGLLRANGPFSHPIVAGLFLASFLPIFVYSGLRKWPFVLGLGASFFAVFSGSSGAYLALLVAIGLMLFDWVQHKVSFLSWKLFFPAVGLLLSAAQVGTNSGVIALVMRAALNPATAYYRRFIWEYGSQSVMEHPLFGIGFQEFKRLSWMTASVDHHWLLLAMRFGIAPAALLLIVMLSAVMLLSYHSGRQSAADRQLFRGIAIAIFGFTLLGATVAYFGGVQAWLYMLTGIGISLAVSAKDRATHLARAASRAGAMQFRSGAPAASGPVSRSPMRGQGEAQSQARPGPIHPRVRAKQRAQALRNRSR